MRPSTWFGPDFKFQNNTDFPLGIVASYEKPKLTVKIYGRKLADGLTISLRSTRDETIPVDPPIYKPNPSLAPGQVVEIREGALASGQLPIKFIPKTVKWFAKRFFLKVITGRSRGSMR